MQGRCVLVCVAVVLTEVARDDAREREWAAGAVAADGVPGPSNWLLARDWGPKV